VLEAESANFDVSRVAGSCVVATLITCGVLFAEEFVGVALPPPHPVNIEVAVKIAVRVVAKSFFLPIEMYPL
jgi:hypothetical protein